jgi:hypothetical protein
MAVQMITAVMFWGAQAAQPVLFGSLPKSSSTARCINWVSPLAREQNCYESLRPARDQPVTLHRDVGSSS